MNIRAHAMISFGKLCITSTTLAKKHLPVAVIGLHNLQMFIRELEVSKDSVIRNKIIIVIGDICTKWSQFLSVMSRHTSIVERYIPTIANCIIDSDVVVRIHSLSMISKLVLVTVLFLLHLAGRLHQAEARVIVLHSVCIGG